MKDNEYKTTLNFLFLKESFVQPPKFLNRNEQLILIWFRWLGFQTEIRKPLTNPTATLTKKNYYYSSASRLSLLPITSPEKSNTKCILQWNGQELVPVTAPPTFLWVISIGKGGNKDLEERTFGSSFHSKHLIKGLNWLRTTQHLMHETSLIPQNQDWPTRWDTWTKIQPLLVRRAATGMFDYDSLTLRKKYILT